MIRHSASGKYSQSIIDTWCPDVSGNVVSWGLCWAKNNMHSFDYSLAFIPEDNRGERQKRIEPAYLTVYMHITYESLVYENFCTQTGTRVDGCTEHLVQMMEFRSAVTNGLNLIKKHSNKQA